MMISVIIPIYNAEKTLRRCLDSLLPQARGCAELILVNDGSTDGSEQICLLYSSAYPEVRYIRKENGGVSSARNAGLAAAEGDYVTFVDSDDYVSPNYFTTLTGAEDTDFLFFSAETERNGIRTGYIDGSSMTIAENHEVFIREFIKTRNGSPWNKRFRRSVICQQDIRFPTDLYLGEDFIFCLRYLLNAKTASVIDQVLYHQDESNDNSLTKKFNANMTDQTLRIYELAEEAVSNADLPQGQTAELLQWLDYNRCRTAFACALEYFKTDHTGYRELRQKIKAVLSAFGQSGSSAAPLNLTHRTMKLCVTKQWTLPVYFIAKRRYNHKIAELGG